MKKKKSNQVSQKMWGGRFSETPSSIMEQINSSIDVDSRLWEQDIRGSKAHCRMLMAQKIIPEKDGEKILEGLCQIEKEMESGEFEFQASLEDIHMNIENRLSEIIGEVAGKLHTARSRNDQVATDFRLWMRSACGEVIEKISEFQNVMESTGKQHTETIMPGFTHLQVAQPVTLEVHIDAYVQMMERDKSRFVDCQKRLNESPLGACALSGTGFPIDREMTAKELGFARVMPNTIDAVSSRDFATEFLFSCAQCGVHLSRFAEEIILWATPQFGFIELSDDWSTGSSIMPQKKNPDAAELVRSKAGRLSGNLIQLLTVMKALPLSYNKDMQEDKSAVFESFDTLILCLSAMGGMVEKATFSKKNMRSAAESGYATATELADWLVRELDIPFRQAHHITGSMVKLASERKCVLEDIPIEDMQDIEPRITNKIFDCLNLDNAVKSRRKN